MLLKSQQVISAVSLIAHETAAFCEHHAHTNAKRGSVLEQNLIQTAKVARKIEVAASLLSLGGIK